MKKDTDGKQAYEFMGRLEDLNTGFGKWDTERGIRKMGHGTWDTENGIRDQVRDGSGFDIGSDDMV